MVDILELDSAARSPARRVWLLGGLRVADASGPIPVPAGLSQRLLAYLALHSGRQHGREALADLFWPDDPLRRARRKLSDLLYRLRQAIGPEWLVSEEDRIGLNAASDIWIDVEVFEELSAAGDPDALGRAVALYKDDLLPEIYDDWVLVPRAALREKYLHCLLRLGQVAEAHDRPEQACEQFRRLVAADPLREEAQRGLMRGLARLGRYAEALRIYETLVATLERELDVPPSAETRALAEVLRAELDQRRRAPALFVGRVAERAQLLERLERAQAGRGGLVVLLGEAGIGKTRLLKELARAAAWRGWQVTWGHGQEFGLPAPYAPLRQALDAALPEPRLQQLARQVPPLWLATLSGLVPRAAELIDPTVPSAGADRLPVAVRHVLNALGRTAPHLFVLEDVQWAHPAFWTLLDDLRTSLTHVPVLMVLSGRDAELRAPPAGNAKANEPMAWSRLEAWDRSGETIIHLAGLAPQELEELVVTHGQRELTAVQRAELNAASGGNPLLALTLLDVRHQEPAAAPSALADLMARRLSDLSQEGRQVLRAAAVLGYRFHYPPWEMVAREDVPAEDLAPVAGRLERAGLIALEADGYRFAHDTLRAFVYRGLSEGQRRELHRRALTALSRYTPQATLDLLYHAEGAADQPAVARYALQAGQQALEAWTLPAAVGYFTQALEALPPDDRLNRFSALLGRERALKVLADREAQRDDLSCLKALADRLGDVRRQAQVAQRRADFAWQEGDQGEARSLAEQGLELARRAGDVALEAALLETLGRIARNQGDYGRTLHWIRQAHSRFVQAGDRFGQASTLDKLANLAFEAGDYQEAAREHTRAAAMFRRLGAVIHEARALDGLGIALRKLKQFDKARETHQQVLSIVREAGDRHGEWVELANLGGIGYESGDYAAAADQYTRALAICRAINDPRGISMMLNNLGFSHRGLGQTARALAYFDEALQINRDRGYRRGEAYTQKGRGLVLLDAGRHKEARPALEAAQAIWRELDDPINGAETVAALALVHLAVNDLDNAQVYLHEALETLDARPLDAFLRQWIHYVAYRVRHARGQDTAGRSHLLQARAAMQEIVDSLPVAARERFLTGVPLNRLVRDALAALTTTVQVRLVRAEVPLGRKLTDADYVALSWTIHAPGDDEIPNKAERRRHVLRRLLSEAAAQGAAPTDDDLAAALGVSRRTVLRDMRVLAAQGVALSTRGRA